MFIENLLDTGTYILIRLQGSPFHRDKMRKVFGSDLSKVLPEARRRVIKSELARRSWIVELYKQS